MHTTSGGVRQAERGCAIVMAMITTTRTRLKTRGPTRGQQIRGWGVLTLALLSPLLCCCGDECYCTDEMPEGRAEASTEELELVESINRYREDEGLAPLMPSVSLFAAAHRQAYDLQENELPLDHIGSDGSTVIDRAAEAGYDAACITENAHGLWSCGFVGVPCVLSSWQDSRGHDDNLLDEEARAIGVGIHGGITIAVFGCIDPEDPI